MITFKSLRSSLAESIAEPVKTFNVGKKTKVIISKNGQKFALYINGELLDDTYTSVADAEAAAKEFADLLGA
jgi:hypothetical protein